MQSTITAEWAALLSAAVCTTLLRQPGSRRRALVKPRERRDMPTIGPGHVRRTASYAAGSPCSTQLFNAMIQSNFQTTTLPRRNCSACNCTSAGPACMHAQYPEIPCPTPNPGINSVGKKHHVHPAVAGQQPYLGKN